VIRSCLIEFLLTCPQIVYQDVIRFAEVKFFFLKTFGGTTKALAIVSLYSPPDDYLLYLTHNTLCVCEYQGEDYIVVIDVKSILSVITMVPFPFILRGHGNQYFMIEQIGLDISEVDTTEDDPQVQ